MYDKKEIAHNLKAGNEQLADDLNGVMTPLQRKLMKEVISHTDELDEHIRNLDDDISSHMNDDEKKASAAIQGITGIAESSANAVISVIGTDMGRFPTDAHRGSKRAYVAVAHSMLIAIYHVLKDGVAFKDLGSGYYNQFNKERKINAYLKKLKASSWEAPAAMTGQPA